MNLKSTTATVDAFARHFQVQESYRAYFEKISQGVLEHLAEIDAQIASCAHHWKLSRMSKVDLAIMRIACFELMFCPETDPKILLDEAVELAKVYSSQESSAFVNGILDQISKRVRTAA